MAVKKYNKSILNVVKSLLTPLLNFSIAIIGIRVFGESDWGNWVSITLTLFFFLLLSNWGNKEFMIRSFALDPNSISKQFSKSLFSRSLFLLFGLVLFFFVEIEEAFLMLLFLLLNHTYQSFDAVIVYQHKYLLFIIVELIGFLGIIGSFFLIENFNVVYMLIVFNSMITLKLLVTALVFRKFWSFKNFTFGLEMIKEPFFFFLIGFSGFLQSKVDLYIVAFVLENEVLSKYQILLTVFLMIQGVSGMMLQPFAKNLYRANENVFKKLKQKIAVFGVLFVTVATVIAFFLLELLLPINFPGIYFVLMGLASLPVFLYVIDIYQLYRLKNEKLTMYVSFIGAIINLAISIVLIQYLEVLGAIIGVLISQWLILLIYKLRGFK